MHFKKYDVGPPGNWHYTEPRSGASMGGVTFQQMMDRVEQHYRNMGYGEVDQLAIEQAMCGALDPEDRAEFCTDYAAPWPLLLQPLRLLARDGDAGLGDVVERVVGPVGGDAYKHWFQTVFGLPCGCKRRQDNLNRRYPL